MHLKSYIFVAATLLLTVIGQILIKARANTHHSESGAPLHYLFSMLTDVWVIFAFACAGTAALCWVMAMRHLPVAYAYPFIALSFLLVPVCAHWFLGEPLHQAQIPGLLFIVLGVAWTSIAQPHAG